LINLGDNALSQEDYALAQTCSAQALSLAHTVGSRYLQGFALTVLGQALLGLERLDQAADAYAEAFRVQQELGQPNLAIGSRAGLARVALAQGDAAKALAHVDAILAYLEVGTLKGTGEPFLVELTCYEILRSVGDPRAPGLLESFYQQIQAQAAKITDEATRHMVLENVPSLLKLVAAWHARGIQ
jgi:tetratricopeptide (TPR) repeat protein